MKSKNLKSVVEKLLDLSNINLRFIVEFKEKKCKYIVAEGESDYQLERKIGNRRDKFSLKSYNDLEELKDLSQQEKEIFLGLFKLLKNNQIHKISIGGLRLRNPILTASIGQSIIPNVSKQISSKDTQELYTLWKKRKKEQFEERFYNTVVNTLIIQLKDKLESDDLPTPVFPTGVALNEIPNYYICEPKEIYTLETKMELFNKLADTICGRCGQNLYGLYIPEEGFDIKEVLKNYVSDFYNLNIANLAGVGRINLPQIGAFEYLFYLLDKVLQEMFRRNVFPDFHVELFVVEGMGGGKKFYSHYVIPNLNETYLKLYYGDDRYTRKGISKIKDLISSFLVENWRIDNNLKRNNSEIAHSYINRLLYYIFCHRRLDMDAILFLEDLKIKLADTMPIRYLEEVISWM